MASLKRFTCNIYFLFFIIGTNFHVPTNINYFSCFCLLFHSVTLSASVCHGGRARDKIQEDALREAKLASPSIWPTAAVHSWQGAHVQRLRSDPRLQSQPIWAVPSRRQVLSGGRQLCRRRGPQSLDGYDERTRKHDPSMASSDVATLLPFEALRTENRVNRRASVIRTTWPNALIEDFRQSGGTSCQKTLLKVRSKYSWIFG